MPNMMVTAEKVIRKKTNQILTSATKKYKTLMRKAANAANEHKREQYIGAAIGAVVLAGVAASKMKSVMGRRATAGLRAAKRKKKKAKL